MKFKKIISAVSAFAMAASLFTVASAASLGGKPTVTASFDGYEKVSDTVAFAYVNVTLDMSAAEALEVYSNELDEITWEEVVKGNGITTLGIGWTVPTGFTYTKAKSTIPAGLTVSATNVAFGPKTSAEEFWTTPVTTVRLAYRVSNFDAKGDITLPTGGTTVDGKNSAEGSVWSYSDAAGTVTLTGCSIPSYNEWSKPAGPTYEDKYVDAVDVPFAALGDNEVAGTDVAAAYKASYTFAGTEKAAAWTATGKGDYAIDLANLSGETTLGLIVTDGVVSNVQLKVTAQAN